MTPKFQRRIENFSCGHCGTKVHSDGYTNHCSKCLFSKHVDINPGDRAATCGGMMEPIAIEGSTGAGYILRHRCTKCGYENHVRVSPDDEAGALVGLAQPQF